MEYEELSRGLNIIHDNVRTFFEGEYDTQKFRNNAMKLAGDLSSYDNSKMAGRMLIYDISRPCSNLRNYINVMGLRLHPNIKKFMIEHIDRMQTELTKTKVLEYRDHDYFSASTLIKLYLLKPAFDEEAFESPGIQKMRMATQFYYEQGIDRVIQCFYELSCGYYSPASPTQFNAGTDKPQMSSCFLLEIGDTLDSILYTGVGDSGVISSLNGGLGIGLSNLRHSQVGLTGMSSGILPVARIYDKLIKYVDQRGKRSGAGTAFLDISHIDIWDFIEATDNFKSHDLRLSDLNTCIWMHDLFFRRVSQKGNWTVFCPAKAKGLIGTYGYEFVKLYEHYEALAEKRMTEYKQLKEKLTDLKVKIIKEPNNDEYHREYESTLLEEVTARKACIEHKVYKAEEIFKKIIDIQVRSGMPYLMNGDTINAKSNQSNIGVVNSSNLCQEITEVSTPDNIASCNLSAINIAKYVKSKVDKAYSKISVAIYNAFNFDLFGMMVQSMVENLNSVIDHNYYPLDERDKQGKVTKQGKISEYNLKARPLGLGCHGFDDAIKMMDLAYESIHTEVFNKLLFACYYFNALIASVKLSIKHGHYDYFKTGQCCLTYFDDNKQVMSKIMRGSYMANGILQFDLWRHEASVLKANGHLDEKIYCHEDDVPIDPQMWGQNYDMFDHNGTIYTFIPDWNDLKEMIQKHGVRNSLFLSNMPTASTAQILNNSETLEAHQSNLYSRNVNIGSFTVCNRHLSKDLGNLGLWHPKLIDFIAVCQGSVKYLIQFVEDHHDLFPHVFEERSPNFDNQKYTLISDIRERLRWLTEKYKTMFEISQKTFLKYTRQRAIYIDQSQSTNIHVSDPTVEKMSAIHSYTQKLRLKTCMYYLRQESAKPIGAFNISSEIIAYHAKLTGNKKIDTPIVCTRESNCISCQ